MDYIAISFILVYQLFFILFNHGKATTIANLALVALVLFSALRVIYFKKYKEQLFKYVLIYAATIGLIMIVSNFLAKDWLEYKPILLLLILLSSFSICSNNIKLTKTLLFLSCVLITLSLSLIIFVNFSKFKGMSNTASEPFMNLDTFGSYARNSLCISFVFLIHSFTHIRNNKKIISFVCLIILLVCFLLSLVLVLLSRRLGSIELMLIVFITFLYLFLLRRKHYFLVVCISLLIAMGFILLITIPSNNDIVKRAQVSIYQMFNPFIILDASARERTVMLYRDFVLSNRFLLLGMGTDGVAEVIYTNGHNIFGCYTLSYGLLATILYSMPFVYVFSKRRTLPTLFYYFSIYFFIVNLFDIFYGMGAISRNNYIYIGALISFLTFAKKDLATSRENYVCVSI